MQQKRLSAFLIIVITATQLVGPAALWANEPERGIGIKPGGGLIVAGLQGQAHTTSSANHPHEKRALQFGQPLGYGDQLLTGPQSRAEVLIGHQALLTLEEDSSIGLTTTTAGTTLVEMHDGAVRLAVAASQLAPAESVTVRTATTTVVTRDGVFQVRMAAGEAPATAQRTAGKSTMVRVAYPPSTLVAKDEAPSVTYQVMAGTVTVTGTGQSVPVTAGQSVQVLAGQIGVPFVTPAGEALPAPLTALAQHGDTPKSGVTHLISQEMRQAEVLGLLLTNAGYQPSELEKQEESEQGVILALTGVSLPGGSQGGGIRSLAPRDPGGVALEVGGTATGVVDPPSDANPDIGIGFDFDVSKPKGGGGLLLFDDSQVTLDAGGQLNTELMLIDGGDPKQAPHQGKIPTERLTVEGLESPFDKELPDDNLFLSIPMGNPNGQGVGTLPPSCGSECLGPAPHILTRKFEPDDSLFLTEEARNEAIKNEAIKVLEAFASGLNVNPGDDFADEGGLLGLVSDAPNPDVATEGVHGVIRARDGGDSVTVKGGVVLNNNTHVVATSTRATAEYFQQLNDIEGSIVAVLGRNFDVVVEDLKDADGEPYPVGFPNDAKDGIPDTPKLMGGQLNPANVKVQDRVLAVLDGSSITPDTSDPNNIIPRVSLLTILDSRLEGPTEPPDRIPGDDPVFAVEALRPKSRADIPPLIEIINSRTHKSSPWAVEAHSAIVVRGSGMVVREGELAQGILEASGPLVSLFASTMKTTGDFVNVQGNGTGGTAQLMASLQQSNVLQGAVQLNNSQLQVGGHLFNFLNGATGAVTGNLTALANDSILSVNGALVAVGLNSSFTLTGGSLVAFGFGTNTVNITGTSGTCAGCNLSTTVPNLSGIPVLLHPSANVSVGNGFVPYAGVGQGTIGGVNFNNTVNVSSGAAVLQVDQGGTLTLNP